MNDKIVVNNYFTQVNIDIFSLIEHFGALFLIAMILFLFLELIWDSTITLALHL